MLVCLITSISAWSLLAANKEYPGRIIKAELGSWCWKELAGEKVDGFLGRLSYYELVQAGIEPYAGVSTLLGQHPQPAGQSCLSLCRLWEASGSWCWLSGSSSTSRYSGKRISALIKFTVWNIGHHNQKWRFGTVLKSNYFNCKSIFSFNPRDFI